MVYAAELDDQVFEVRRGASELIYFWPKAPGVGNTAATFTSATIHKPGDSTTAITSITPTLRTIDDVSRFDFTVDASATDVYELDENYRIEILWSYVDADAVTRPQLSTVRFDVCREPMNPQISLNDLLDEVHDIGARLTSMGRAIGTRTAEQLASVFGLKAWQDVRARLRSTLQGEGKILPRCLLDRTAVRRATVAAAIRSIYVSIGGGEDTEAADQRAFWSGELSARIREIGAGGADYDSDDDGVADQNLRGFSSVRVRRGWR